MCRYMCMCMFIDRVYTVHYSQCAAWFRILTCVVVRGILAE